MESTGAAAFHAVQLHTKVASFANAAVDLRHLQLQPSLSHPLYVSRLSACLLASML
jgi:hypothetical protein